MWARIKRIFRSIIGWFVDLAEDPELILKQNIRDLQNQVPQINEQLAMVKAQVTLTEKALKKLEEKETDLVSKIKAALKNERRDVAVTYATTLEEVRREKAQQEQQLKVAQAAYEKAKKVREAFMRQMEEKIQESNKALGAKRQAEWQAKVASTMENFAPGGIDATHDEMIEQIERDAALAEAKLDMALDNSNADQLDIEKEAKRMQANETLAAIEAELGLTPDINAAPEADEQEKTLGEARETA